MPETATRFASFRRQTNRSDALRSFYVSCKPFLNVSQARPELTSKSPSSLRKRSSLPSLSTATAYRGEDSLQSKIHMMSSSSEEVSPFLRFGSPRSSAQLRRAGPGGYVAAIKACVCLVRVDLPILPVPQSADGPEGESCSAPQSYCSLLIFSTVGVY